VVIIFDLVRFLSKKITKPFFLKKMVSSQLNQTKTGSNRPVLVWFGFFRTKTGSTGLARFFPVWFYFLVWLGFFLV